MGQAGEPGLRSGRVETEGDALYYEVRGAGPPLLLIHGGVLDAGGFAPAARLLARDFTVITYDRRGYSRSTRRDPQNFEIGQQARDAVALLRAEGHASAIIFGNSGGAIIGLEMARSHPEAVALLVAHEPPVMRVLPNADEVLTAFARVYLTTWEEGPEAGMRLFGALNAIPRTDADRAALDPEDVARTRGNIAFFLKQEMLPFANYMPDSETIRKHGVRVVLAAGEQSRDRSHGQTAPIVAEQLGCPFVVFPGHHTSYLGMPEPWTVALRGVIGDGGWRLGDGVFGMGP